MSVIQFKKSQQKKSKTKQMCYKNIKPFLGEKKHTVLELEPLNGKTF